MADPMMMNEYTPEMEQLALRRKYAEMLRQQAMQPVQGAGMAGRTVAPISWVQGLAQMLKGASADATDQQTMQGSQALAQRYSADRKRTLAEALAKARGMPMQGSEDAAGNVNVQQQAVPPDLMGAGAQLFGASDPALQHLGGQVLQQQFVPKKHVVGHSLMSDTGQVIGTDPAFAQQKEADRQEKTNNLIMQLAQSANDKAAQRQILIQLKQMGVDSAMALKQAALAARPDNPVTAVTIQDPNDPNGTIIIDGRTRQVLGKGPKLTDTGKLENKRAFNMQGIGATIQKAEDILSGKGGRDLPTGSTVGNVMDIAGGLVGYSPSGAKESETLKAVGGALVSKMPRMEGPQSDKDVMLYKEMAGRVGDPTVPRDRRIAALEEVKNLWAKYERLNPDAFADRRDQPPPGAVRPR